jgi:hypothetical protein
VQLHPAQDVRQRNRLYVNIYIYIYIYICYPATS